MTDIMGYVTKDIANITEPKVISLVGLPNFVQFASKPRTPQKLELNITVTLTPASANVSTIKIVDALGTTHTFYGTTDQTAVSGNIFYISVTSSDTAENIRLALLSDRWITTNFDIVVPFALDGSNLVNGNTINLKSKGTGKEFNVDITAPDDTIQTAYTFDWINQTSVNGDTISGEYSTATIELDVYTNTGVFLGEDDKAITAAKLGTPLTSLLKTYAGSPVWFDLNSIFSNSIGYNIPPASGWFNTGTIKDIRFVAKVKAVNSYPFYQSKVLYILNGYAPLDNPPNLEDYVYNSSTVKLLTNKPVTKYVRGQKAYLNFIFSDAQRNAIADNYELRVAYQVFTQSGRYLSTEYAHPIKRLNLSIVNTCVLNIDSILDLWPTAGIVKVALARDTIIVSNDLEYQILPECLHTLRQFSFINSFGGWDCFNFDAVSKTDIKQSTETYNKTITPAYKVGDSVETVYTSDLEKLFTVVSAPVSDEVAKWLEELAASIVVLDGEGRYIIKEDFTLQLTAENKNVQRATIKYRLS